MLSRLWERNHRMAAGADVVGVDAQVLQYCTTSAPADSLYRTYVQDVLTIFLEERSLTSGISSMLRTYQYTWYFAYRSLRYCTDCIPTALSTSTSSRRRKHFQLVAFVMDFELFPEEMFLSKRFDYRTLRSTSPAILIPPSYSHETDVYKSLTLNHWR